RDISDITRALFSPGMLVPEFDKPPPTGWPKALENDWAKGNAACKARVSARANRMSRASAAVECQKELSRALYARFLDHEKPDLVLEVTAADAQSTPDGSRVVVFARALTPPWSQARTSSEEVPRADAVSTVHKLAVLLLGSGGNPVHVDLPRALPRTDRP